MRHSLPALVAVVVVLGTVGALAVAPAVADDPDAARLTVTDVSVSPATPVPGEPVTLGVSLRNSAGSPSPVGLDTVRVETAAGEVLARATDPGTLSAGDTLTVPLTHEFDRAGAYDLTVVATGTNASGGPVSVSRPVSLVVEDAPAQVEVRPEGPVTGTTTTVTVRVGNPTESQLRDVEVRLNGNGNGSGSGLRPVRERRTVPAIPAGGTATVNLSVRGTTPGPATLETAVSYHTGSGETATVTRTRTVDVAPVETDLGVRVSRLDSGTEEVAAGAGGIGGQLGSLLGGAAPTGGGQDDDRADPSQVEVTVTNFGNAPVGTAVVTPVAGNTTLDRYAVPGPLAPGASRSVTVDLAELAAPTAVEFRVRYRVGAQEASATDSLEVRPPRGRVTVTGVSLSVAEDGTVTVQGNAGNAGSAEVRGLVLSVVGSETVAPTYPQRDYFVGTVEGSEFAPFELTADVDLENATSVAVALAYETGGETVERTVTLPVESDLERPTGSGGSVPFGLLGVGTVVVVVVALTAVAAVVAVRRWG